MVLLKAERAQAALVASNEAIERGETIVARLNSSLALLRGSRDQIAEKLRSDTVAPAQPEAPRRVWSFL